MPKERLKAKAFDVHRNLPHHPISSQPAKEPPGPDKSQIERPKRRFTWKKIVALFFIILLSFVVVIGTWDARNFSRASQKMFGSSNLFSLLSPASLKADSNGRVNVLIVGYSVDDPGHPGADLTDSIILLSMNQNTHHGYMLSIPRDLYVKIPGTGGYGKINEAYKNGGMPILEEIISRDFQQPIHYYALVNYGAVRGTVNALNGITVDIKSPDPRGLYDTNISPADGGPLRLSNGPQKLDGQTALNLTRARGDAYGSYGFSLSDFDRSQHQRQIFTAIKQQLSWRLILNPRKNGQLFDAVGQNLKTDIGLDEVRPLYGLFHTIPDSQLQSISLNKLNGKNFLQSYTTFSGQSALIPAAGLSDYSQIQAVLSQL